MSTRTGSGDVKQAVQDLLHDALARRASDVHLEPTGEGYEIRSRVDGMLKPIDRLDAATGRGYVNRLMVAAGLLTYHLDVPQEGQFRIELDTSAERVKALDLRLAIMPTTHGLRAVVRLPAELLQPRSLETLDLPAATYDILQHFAAADGGMLLMCGPAGSGKTTTIYALLEHIVQRSSGLSVISLEDPVERDLPGVTQIEVTPFGNLTYETALRSILRQDPQVLALGEIRDRATASIAVQAALSGHRLVSTLHAGSPEGAVVRLLEMGLEPYQVASSLFAVVSTRLLRRGSAEAGYAGRVPIAEVTSVTPAVRQALLAQGEAGAIRSAIESADGFVSLRAVAASLVHAGVTDEAEVQRALGG
ncbi:GspE/PulE family protein [Phycisphaerales bacterium AB-hyl4]|uniref:GspE/PulE family protein n=1 Tax=Natronomicrosphaera hydrolytica TaxID=3242702 RepID=A0ABV4U9U3_9BACT